MSIFYNPAGSSNPAAFYNPIVFHNADAFARSSIVTVTVKRRMAFESCNFYVHESLLVWGSRLFEARLGKRKEGPDQIPKVDLQLFSMRDTDFANFTKWLYTGGIEPNVIRDDGMWLFEMAADLQSLQFQNFLADEIQRLEYDDVFITLFLEMSALPCLHRSHVLGYMLEKMAFEATIEGWYKFDDLAGDDWSELFLKAGVAREFNRLCSDAFDKHRQSNLVDPALRMDCRLHEHTEEDWMQCERHLTPLPDDFEPYFIELRALPPCYRFRLLGDVEMSTREFQQLLCC